MPTSSESSAAKELPVLPEEGRPSAVQPEAHIARRVPPFYGAIFYGFLFLVAWVWLRGTGQSVEALWRPRNWLAEIAIGAAAGLLLIVATPVFVRRVRALGALEREFGWILGEQRAWECVFLAILSGVAEEFFFRGALLHAVGPGLALLVFAALHWPINAQFRAWPITALMAGAVLTAERLVTGTLLAPVITHVVVNAVNLLRITARHRVWKE